MTNHPQYLKPLLSSNFNSLSIYLFIHLFIYENLFIYGCLIWGLDVPAQPNVWRNGCPIYIIIGNYCITFSSSTAAKWWAEFVIEQNSFFIHPIIYENLPEENTSLSLWSPWVDLPVLGQRALSKEQEHKLWVCEFLLQCRAGSPLS